MFTNYKYIVTPTKVIALSTYAGKVVRGVAKCHPHDIFDEDFGKALAAARCNKKIAAKRYARAQQEYMNMTQELRGIRDKAQKVANYLHDAYDAYIEARDTLREFDMGEDA